MHVAINKRVMEETDERNRWVRFPKRTHLPREYDVWRLVELGFGGVYGSD